MSFTEGHIFGIFGCGSFIFQLVSLKFSGTYFFMFIYFSAKFHLKIPRNNIFNHHLLHLKIPRNNIFNQPLHHGEFEKDFTEEFFLITSGMKYRKSHNQDKN